MACVIVRTTFRIHDNPLLDRALTDPQLATVYLPIDAGRVPPVKACLPQVEAHTHIRDPHFVHGTSTHRHAWGYHQYAFLLLAMQSFVHDLRNHLDRLSSAHKQVRIQVHKGSVTELVRRIARNHRTAYIDRVDDPAWKSFDTSLTKAFSRPAGLQWVTTQTLLDWHTDTECLAYLTEWRKGWSIPYANKRFREYVTGRLNGTNGSKVDLPSTCKGAAVRDTSGSHRKRVTRPSRRNGRRSRSAPPRLGGRAETKKRASDTFDLETEWRRWTDAMKHAGLRPYDVVRTNLEQYALKEIRRLAPAMSKADWEKPLTNISLGLRDHVTDGSKNTSKLSPYFALGVLSPRTAFARWWGSKPATKKQNEARPSSAIAQLIWRETFHAASCLPLWWTTRNKTLPPAKRFWRHELSKNPQAPYGGWRVWKSNDTDPLYRGWITATTQHPDLDESLVLLVIDGWVHHLRRHMIADYLTRGKVQADWMLGEQWFRQTLVDHDACINRGNWMWLSAADFSTLQFRQHYGYSNYVQKRSYGQRVRPLPSAKLSGGGKTRSHAKTNNATKRTVSTRTRGTRAHSKASNTMVTTACTQHSSEANQRRYYGGYPDPRKAYDGHYKSPPCALPPSATVYKTRGKRPTRNTKTKRFHFADHPSFDPDCAPYEVLQLGAFGGTYFRDIWSGTTQSVIVGKTVVQELPKAWWASLDMSTQLCSSTYNKQVNHFKAACGGSLDMWETSGWINPIDPYGWFQWYCRFFQGRRTSDDERQIARWAKFTNPSGRFVKPLLKKCKAKQTSLQDASISPVTRQNLLHWGRLRFLQSETTS